MDSGHIRSLSEILQDFLAHIREGDISIDAILEAFHERGFGFFLMFLSLPMLVPVPKPPGFTTFFGIPLALLCCQQMLGYHRIWMPEFIRKRQLPRDTVIRTVQFLIPYLTRIEPWLHPRLGHMTQGYFSHLIGFTGMLMSASILLPLPGSNMIPALGLSIMSAGVIVRDGVAVIVGALIGLIYMILYYGLIILIGQQGLGMISQAHFF
jgi:hypothetical protein